MGGLRYSEESIVWQEVPGEVSLAFSITGCPLRCKGCHSARNRNPRAGELLSLEYFSARLNQYKNLITCVLFLGGDWQELQLKRYLKMARALGLHTCLYTGLDEAPEGLLPYLTYLKTGPWIASLGGLDNPATNQRFIDLRTSRLLNHLFQQQQK